MEWKELGITAIIKANSDALIAALQEYDVNANGGGWYNDEYRRAMIRELQARMKALSTLLDVA